MSGTAETPLPGAVVIRTSFADHKRGDVITDPAVIAELCHPDRAGVAVAVSQEHEAFKPAAADTDHDGEG